MQCMLFFVSLEKGIEADSSKQRLCSLICTHGAMGCSHPHSKATYYARMLLLYPSKTESTQPTTTTPDVSKYEQAEMALAVNRQVPRFAVHVTCWGACCDLVYQILGFE